MSFFGGNNKKIEERAIAPREEIQPEPAREIRPTYGIRNAILLMRTVPVDQNAELVVSVIKTTLESLKVKVSDIIEDATRRQQEIENRVADLRQQILEYEREILTRKDEIGRLEADYAETTMVKGRLELAEQLPGRMELTEQIPRGLATPIPRQMMRAEAPVARDRMHDAETDIDIE